ncbi:hypothetical protein IFO69_20170 [Echinicola sp. CAU 1574]|uniref:ApeA N-terminal domain-containing protein n=1 Tax=Echinicola arenosa TaxID=2774144 RepID=A0ABR9AQL8_9BACT|nr:hypothetical protein [Echinicola arenosa]MBD8491081.1 hypothetical protein [Echinicola arenosa]
MKITARNINQIKESFKKLVDKYQQLSDEYDPDDSVYEISIGMEEIQLPFPKDPDAFHQVSDFIRLMNEFESIRFESKNKVITTRFSQRAIFCNDQLFYEIVENGKNNLEFTFNDITLRIVNNPILIGLGSLHYGLWDKYVPPCSSYNAIEVEYKGDRSNVNEDELITSYIYSLAVKFDFDIHLIDVYDSGLFDFDTDEEVDPKNHKIDSIESYNFGMDLYLKANRDIDEEMRLLYYYKVLEFFAPVEIKKNANEKLRLKLFSPKATEPDANFLQSIFALTKRYEEDLRDNELIKPLLRECIDIVDLYEFLPESIKHKIRRELKISIVSYDLDSQNVIKLSDYISTIIYATRNSFVHAKSNYSSNGKECTDEELADLNIFLKHTCNSVIKWYNRLPNHLKIMN